MIDYEEALCEVSDVLRAHNKVVGGISHQEACELILDAVRPKGKWITDNPLQENDDGAFRCSCCKVGSWHWGNSYHFCPNCGARMER